MAYDRNAELAKIYRQQPSVTDDQKLIIGDLYDDWLIIALSKSNRIAGQEVPALLAIVRDTVIGAYNKRGDEGMKESNVGGQTYYYDDLEKIMLQKILNANLRVFKL